jgi:hypothetical protein
LLPPRELSKLDSLDRDRIRDNLDSVRARIADAARRSGRVGEDVTLVAVTKRHPPELVAPLVELGAADLGENYPQELWKKYEALAGLPVRWHLIGHLQSNKAKKTSPMVRMIHAVDSLKLLQGLDELAGSLAAPPAVCLQVNTSGEAAKHGWSPEAILRDAEPIAACRRIPVVGLMTMAALDTTAESARPSFVRLREVRDALRRETGLELGHLSMGMSNDFETAIEEGSTLVRVGSALFEGVAP